MKGRTWAVVAVVGVVGLWVAPPFAVIDDGSGGARHAALSHYPAWDPPSSVEAEAALTRLVGPPEPGSVPRLRVKRNNVRLGLETLIVLLAAAVLALLGRRAAHPPADAAKPSRGLAPEFPPLTEGVEPTEDKGLCSHSARSNSAYLAGDQSREEAE
jgi:hypothetical protein